MFVPNKSYHDFEGVTEFGEVRFMTEGRIPNRYMMNDLAMLVNEALSGAKKDDILLVAGPTTINCLASAVMAIKHGRVNFLFYDKNADKYTQRTVVFQHDYAKSGAGKGP